MFATMFVYLLLHTNIPWSGGMGDDISSLLKFIGGQGWIKRTTIHF